MITRPASLAPVVVVAPVVLLAFAALLLLRPLPAAAGPPVAYAVMAATATAACVAMVRRGLASTGALRRARLLVAGALVCGALGGVISMGVQLATGEPAPVPSVEDAVHFGFLPLCVLGLLAYPTASTAGGSALRSLLDGAVASLALWSLTWVLLLEPAGVGADLPLAQALTTLAYPTADLFVLGMLAGVLQRVAPTARRELALTGGGFAVYCVSDLAYTVVSTGGGYRADSWISVVAEAGLLLMLVGTSAAARPLQVVPVARSLTLLTGLPVLAVIVLVAVTGLQGRELGGVELAAATAMTGGLLARQAVASRDARALTARLVAREELFRSLVNGGSDLITLTDPVGTVLWASPAVARTVGREDLEGESLLEQVHPDDQPGLALAAVSAREDPDGQAEVLCRLGSPSGWRWMQVRFQDRQDDPAVGGLICNARDVHDRHLLEQQLSRAAYHDSLTGLGNRARGQQLLTRCYDGRSSAVLLVDLDGFKQVNDTYGHAYGDALLVEVAERLRAGLRDGDEVVRLGGDEFVVVLADGASAPEVARRLVEGLREPLQVEGTSLRVSASIGTALAADAGSPDDLLRNADLAMYASKAAGRDRSTAYVPAMHLRAARRMDLQRGLRQALDDDALSLHYQPIVRLSDGAVVGAEALLRWEDQDRGRVETTEAISVAEESGLITEVDEWVLDRACRDVAAWRAAGLVPPRVAVNVSRRHMTAELPGLVMRALAEHRLDGAALCLEVTESAVVADADAAAAALTQVRALGVTVALDDFGSGQSSLSQLARLPVDNVKVDMGFTQSATHDLGARRLLVSILHVCRSLALPVVAEGIEDPALALLLAGVGCELGQGWHYGRPSSAPAFAEVLAGGTLPLLPTPRTERTIVLP